ncbi:MAG: lipase family protein [Lentisphaeraceae bacterium]|nr:lipase family protein [Lentisphaeraceae bacterium]
MINDLDLARFSEQAYKDNVFIEGFDTDFLSRKGTQCHVHAKPGCVIVAFRGTQEIEDILTDISAFKKFKKELSGKIHSGFYQAFLDIYPQLEKCLSIYKAKRQPVIFTGHSLGGALALLAAKWWYDFGGIVARVVTFGCPRVYVKDSARFYDLNSLTFRYEASGDIIPHLPLLLMGYAHVGSCIYLSDHKILQHTWFLRRLFGLAILARTQGKKHSIKNYISILNDEQKETVKLHKPIFLSLVLLLCSCSASINSDWTNIHYEIGIHEERGFFLNIKPPMWDAAATAAKGIKEYIENGSEDDSSTGND